MYHFFRSIGFSRIIAESQQKILSERILDNPDYRYIMSKNVNHIFIDFYKEFGENMGVSLKGTMTEKDDIIIQNIKPYFFSNNILDIHKISIEDVDGDYLAQCQKSDCNLKFNFYIQNKLDHIGIDKNKMNDFKVNIVGLSKGGKIILPLNKGQHLTGDLYDPKAFNFKANIANRSKDGLFPKFKESKESTLNRLSNKNFLSLVETYFLPCKHSKTNYFVLGNIESHKILRNSETNEKLYLLKLSVTGINLEVCINAKDLYGIPMPGMRFMGNAWLQGKLL